MMIAHYEETGMRKRVMVIMACFAIGIASATVLADFAIDWSTVDGGGAMNSTGGGYELSGTIGQPDASAANTLAGGTYTLTGGFWGVTLAACSTFVGSDFDHDCDVDLDDFNKFKPCSTRSGVPYNPVSLPPGCNFTPSGGHIAPDFNHDGDIDSSDFGTFQRCFSGSGLPALTGCDS